MKETSYWAEVAEWPAIVERAWPASVDVAIIGGGYTGLSAARALAKRGARVAVLEANAFGSGASSRNGGMVLTGMKVGAGKLVKQYGLHTARELFRTSLDAIAFAEQLIQDEQIECGFSRCGHVELAWKPAHFDSYQHEAEMLGRDFNHAVTLVERKNLRSEIGSDVYYGALVDAASAGVNPAQYAAGLTAATQRAGAMLFAQTPATAIERDGTAFAVSTVRGKLKAQYVILATNGYTQRLAPWLTQRIIPIGSYVITTEPLPDALAAEISPRRRMMFDSKNFLFYFRLSQDNRMIFGGRAAFKAETPNTVRESAAILQRGMAEVFPQLCDAKISHAWGGTLGFTFDQLPHAGVSPAGIHYALGCGGHGVALLTHLGACVAQQVAGEKIDNPLFTLPFPTAPLGLYDGKPWFLPFAEMYFRALDVLS
jgi:glycine/D-amino acid oxidase-like deaminating enzyme